MKLLCIFLICFDIANAQVGRIIGGTAVDISKIPYQVSLLVNDVFKCGAVIIGTSVAITSVRCVDNIEPSTMTVRAGSSFRTTSGTIHKVSSVTIHPSYSRTTYDYDIAILEISNNFQLGTNVGIVTLPSVGETVTAGSSATVSGWGKTTISDTTYSSNLQVVTVPIVTTAVCTAALAKTNKITDRMICAGYTTGGGDICAGDIGGPLVYGGKLIGIASWGEACGAVGSPGVYTRIAAIRSWLSTEAGV